MANPKITKTGFVGDLTGTADVAKEVQIENLIGYGTTIGSFQDTLKTKIAATTSSAFVKYYKFSADISTFVANWNASNLEFSIKDGYSFLLVPIAPTVASGYAAYLLTSYGKDIQYLMVLSGGVWRTLEKIPSQTDLTELKATLAKQFAPTSHTHTVSQITDFDSSVNTKIANAVTSSNAILKFGSTETVATIAGKSVNVTMPDKPIVPVTMTCVSGTQYSCSVGVSGLFDAIRSGSVISYTIVSGSTTFCRNALTVGTFDYGDTANLVIIQCTDPNSSFSHLWNFAQLVIVQGSETVEIDGTNGSSYVLPADSDLKKLDSLQKQYTSLNSDFVAVSSSFVEHMEYAARTASFGASGYDLELVPGTVNTIKNVGAYLDLTVKDSDLDETGKNLKEAVLRFKTGDTVPSIAWPSGIVWANGEIPTIEANTYYELNFGYVVDKWAVAYQSFKAVSSN